MDLILRLREARRARGLRQEEVAALSGVGSRSISSFETGARIDSLKLSQLKSILRVYGISLADFFAPDYSAWQNGGDSAPLAKLLAALDEIGDESAKRRLLWAFIDMTLRERDAMRRRRVL